MKESLTESSPNSKDWSWTFWFTVPIYPFGQRRTLRQEVIRDTVWTFEQLQGIFYVVVPIRMTIIRLKTGGLCAYAPVAPTPECICLVRELEAQYGLLKYIILPTISGIEHKAFVGPFARKFPQAQVFVAPDQWSFPVNLPLSWLGLPRDRTYRLPYDSTQVPFADEFDYKILGPIELGPGRFEEVVMFHRPSRTLLVTDLIVSIPENPPAIVQLDPYPLLFHAKDSSQDAIADTATNRRKGWQRICLFALYFRPNSLNTLPWIQVFKNSLATPYRSRKAYFGLFPFQWRDNWQQSFQALRRDGRILVAPILQTLILNRDQQKTLDFASEVARWGFERIIPAHFDCPIVADGKQFRQAFDFLAGRSSNLSPDALPALDLQLLNAIDASLTKGNIIPPAR